MTWNRAFWTSIVNSWLSVQTEDDRRKTEIAAENIARSQREFDGGRVKSIEEELFGEEE